jgi:hypothetical protein
MPHIDPNTAQNRLFFLVILIALVVVSSPVRSAQAQTTDVDRTIWPKSGRVEQLWDCDTYADRVENVDEATTVDGRTCYDPGQGIDNRDMVTSRFGPRRIPPYQLHYGLDLRAKSDYLFPVVNSTVANLNSQCKRGRFKLANGDDCSPGFGRYADLKFENFLEGRGHGRVRYAHLEGWRIDVYEGKIVTVTGEDVVLSSYDRIFLSGKTGTTNPHLHLGYYPDFNQSSPGRKHTENPYSLFKFRLQEFQSEEEQQDGSEETFPYDLKEDSVKVYRQNGKFWIKTILSYPRPLPHLNRVQIDANLFRVSEFSDFHDVLAGERRSEVDAGYPGEVRTTYGADELQEPGLLDFDNRVGYDHAGRGDFERDDGGNFPIVNGVWIEAGNYQGDTEDHTYTIRWELDERELLGLVGNPQDLTIDVSSFYRQNYHEGFDFGDLPIEQRFRFDRLDIVWPMTWTGDEQASITGVPDVYVGEDGILTIKDESEGEVAYGRNIVLKEGALLRVGAPRESNGLLIMEQSGEIRVREGAAIRILNGSTLDLTSSSRLTVESGAKIVLEENAELTVDDGAVLRTELGTECEVDPKAIVRKVSENASVQDKGVCFRLNQSTDYTVEPSSVLKAMKEDEKSETTLTVTNNGTTDQTLDIRANTNGKWIVPTSTTLFVPAKGENTQKITFDTQGLRAGTYETTLSFYETKDSGSEKEVIAVPIRIDVTLPEGENPPIFRDVQIATSNTLRNDKTIVFRAAQIQADVFDPEEKGIRELTIRYAVDGGDVQEVDMDVGKRRGTIPYVSGANVEFSVLAIDEDGLRRESDSRTFVYRKQIWFESDRVSFDQPIEGVERADFDFDGRDDFVVITGNGQLRFYRSTPTEPHLEPMFDDDIQLPASAGSVTSFDVNPSTRSGKADVVVTTSDGAHKVELSGGLNWSTTVLEGVRQNNASFTKFYDADGDGDRDVLITTKDGDFQDDQDFLAQLFRNEGDSYSVSTLDFGSGFVNGCVPYKRLEMGTSQLACWSAVPTDFIYDVELVLWDGRKGTEPQVLQPEKGGGYLIKPFNAIHSKNVHKVDLKNEKNGFISGPDQLKEVSNGRLVDLRNLRNTGYPRRELRNIELKHLDLDEDGLVEVWRGGTFEHVDLDEDSRFAETTEIAKIMSQKKQSTRTIFWPSTYFNDLDGDARLDVVTAVNFPDDRGGALLLYENREGKTGSLSKKPEDLRTYYRNGRLKVDWGDTRKDYDWDRSYQLTLGTGKGRSNVYNSPRVSATHGNVLNRTKHDLAIRVDATHQRDLWVEIKPIGRNGQVGPPLKERIPTGPNLEFLSSHLGEIYLVDSSVQFRWTSNEYEDLSLYLYPVFSNYDDVKVADLSPGTSEYTWTVPSDIPETRYYAEVRTKSRALAQSEPFVVGGDAEFIRPIEDKIVTSVLNIEWKATTEGSDVRFDVLNANNAGVHTFTTENDGEHAYQIGSTIEPGSYSLELIDPANGNVLAQSPTFKYQESVRLSIGTAGRTYDVEWDSSTVESDQVDVSIMSASRDVSETIVTTANDGHFEWHVPLTERAGPVLIDVQHATQPGFPSDTQTEIRIDPPLGIAVNDPIDTSLVSTGNVFPIDWKTSEIGAGGNVRIDAVHYPDDFGPSTRHTVTQETSNDGSYRWNVPSGWKTGTYRLLLMRTGTAEGDSVTSAAPRFASTDFVLSKPLDVTLQKGWNLVATNVEPRDADVRAVLGGAADHIQRVEGPEGVWIPASDSTSMAPWTAGTGYAVRASEGATATVYGQSVQSDAPVSLDAGWNVVPYYPDRSGAADVQLREVAGSALLLKDDRGRAYVPDLGVATLQQLRPGRGYKLFAQSADTLRYRGAQAAPQQQGKQRRSSGDRLDRNPRAWVGTRVFEAPTLLLTGIPESVTSLTVWNDATRLADVNLSGTATAVPIPAIDPDRIRLTGEGGQEYLFHSLTDLQSNAPHEGDFATDGIYKAAVDEKADRVRLSVYPNPVTQTSSIELRLPERDEVRVEIYDLLGRRLRVQSVESRRAGTFRIPVEANRLASGVYFVRAFVGDTVRVRKFTVVR